jgi:glycosyltransferase involved in cell wall biosynthesis
MIDLRSTIPTAPPDDRPETTVAASSLRPASPTLRVAIDLTLAATVPTGVGVYARELAARLGDADVAMLPWQHTLVPAGSGRQRIIRGLQLTRWFQLHVPGAVRRERIQVFHSPCSVGPLRLPCSQVMTVHDAVALTMPSQYGVIDRLYFRLFSVVAARRSRIVIVPSSAAREEVARAYRIPAARLRVIPEAVAHRFHAIPRAHQAPVLARYGLRAPYVLFVGADVPRKNVFRLLEAYAAARRGAGIQAPLVMVGPPPPTTRATKATARRFALGAEIRRLEWVPDDDLPVLYSAATCLAYPSLAEGFGLPILEAMACGTPVLTSACSAMPEVAGDAALLVDPRSTEQIAAGLVRLLTEPDLRDELRSRGLARAREFTWERAARATEATYREAAASTA